MGVFLFPVRSRPVRRCGHIRSATRLLSEPAKAGFVPS
jgi:hypothetical protein